MTSRQSKDPVQKCHSDPGAGSTPGTSYSPTKRISRKQVPGIPSSTNTRKCVLTLDGYSYVIVASPPDRRVTRDDMGVASHDTAANTATGCSSGTTPPRPHNPSSPGRNGQLSKQGTLTIVRRSSGKSKSVGGGSFESSPPSHNPDRFLSSQSVDLDEILDNVDLTTDSLPAVDTPDACDKAALRLRCLLKQLQHGEISAELLQRNLHYAARVLETVFIDETKRLADEDDELSEVQPDAVPPEVREWLASTFTRQLATTRRKADEKPKFRSVAHAIRAGIFVDRIYRRVTNTALMQFPPDVVKVLKTLDDWSFDVFSLNEAALGAPVKYIGYDLLNRYGMLHKFKVPPAVLECFLGRIEEGYCRHRNPYHNNLHAADVAQTMHYILCQTGLMNWLTDLEIFSSLVAAIIHDYEHTGTTNNFHVMSGSDTALLYNDRAVLENHHISASFRILREDECNILQNLSREEFREFRSLVIDMVLATDMSFHFQQLKNMKNLLSLAEPSVDKSKAVSLVLHCCDISHPAKRWDLHHRWTMQLLEEFFRQGDKERDLGLPFSPLCDRNNTLVAESQIGFIEFIVEPSMQVCSDMLETVLGPLNVKESVDESANGSTTESNRFKIGKPWIQCLVENKQIWKEQAVRDAELRAQKEAEQNSNAEKEGENVQTTAEE
ncbi:calcium/calmodulin-dependent 3',5'-cyclic nucleotide phosphodiesterase 1-like isoform X7 [Vespa crabro]|uniref:calcium/calmodulin-dependent 3',5'-cyclic nucleotide phosphodiesterase 1-like isoform X7 n=1 Tax=Vespa crabro TaxID=7445 RepID=UPI001F019A95|nr:calcium/calmodulin-dependent 3',5'-cyclic nucleotide phosphodiesterase 1-like isoform X7 [Vespa crabro]